MRIYNLLKLFAGRRFLIFAFTLFGAQLAFCEIIPTDRRVTWAGNVGVPGGIPRRTTIFTNFTSRATAAEINAAIAICPSNQVVFLAAGTYNIGSLFMGRNGVTLRGAGPGATIINSSAASACIYSSEYSQAGAAALASGYTKGSTSVVMSTNPNAQIVPGNLIQFDQDDDTDMVFSTRGPARNLQFISRVNSVSGNTVTFSPPLPFTFKAELSPKLSYQNGGAGISQTGVEDLTITNAANAPRMIMFVGAYSCWIKNIEMISPADTGFFLYGSLQCEMRHCYVHDARNAPSNPDGFGVYVYASSTYCLIEDNIFKTLFVAMWTSGSSANAFLYNYCTNGVYNNASRQSPVMNAGHGPHPMMTLWEGNIGEQWSHDGYHGSASHQTVFRNWIHGLHATSFEGRKMIDLTRGTYYCNVVGNILGDPSWTNYRGFAYEMSGNPGYNEAAVIYRLGYPNCDNNGLSETADNRWQDTYAITYPDQKVLKTLLRHGNYDWYNRAIVWDAAIADHTIPNSLYYASKPGYFGVCPWPPFDPGSPSSISVTNIPAGYRAIYHVDPSVGKVSAPTGLFVTPSP